MAKLRPFTFEGRQWRSVPQACEALGLTKGKLQHWLKLGLERIPEGGGLPVGSKPHIHRFDGEMLTVKEIAERHGTSIGRAYHWIRSGFTERPKPPAKGPYIFEGQEWCTLVDIAEARGVTKQCVSQWLARGLVRMASEGREINCK